MTRLLLARSLQLQSSGNGAAQAPSWGSAGAGAGAQLLGSATLGTWGARANISTFSFSSLINLGPPLP